MGRSRRARRSDGMFNDYSPAGWLGSRPAGSMLEAVARVSITRRLSPGPAEAGVGMAGSGVVVVGVDESADARRALAYGAREAAWLGATLRVVSAFESSGIFGDRYGLPIPVSD